VSRVLAALLLVLASATPAHADAGLTDAVAAAWFPRTVDAGLHAVAHERVAEISACADCMNHDGRRPGTAEVIGYNGGHADPVASIIRQWGTSTAHNAVLSDTNSGRIGCAQAAVGTRTYFVCVLADGPLPETAAAPSSTVEPVFLLPDTALPAP
jgi:hypothetical protein